MYGESFKRGTASVVKIFKDLYYIHTNLQFSFEKSEIVFVFQRLVVNAFYKQISL